MLKPLVITLLALLTAYVINQLPSFSKPFDRLVGRIPLLRRLPSGVQKASFAVTTLAALAAVTAIATAPDDSTPRIPNPDANVVVVAQQELPVRLADMTRGDPLNSDDGDDYLRSVGLLTTGTVFSETQYQACHREDAQDTGCDYDFYYVLDEPSIDWTRFAGAYRGLYGTGDGDCYQHIGDGETLCLHRLSPVLYVVARFQPQSGVGDFKWPFAEDATLRQKDLAHLRDVVEHLRPTGRVVTTTPYNVSYNAHGADITIEMSGLRPNEFVDVEVGSGPGHEDGGVCPRLTSTPCTLLGGTGGRVSAEGRLTVHFSWSPCAELIRPSPESQISGTYPIWIRGRDDRFFAVTAFNVTVPDADRSTTIC